MQIAAQRVGGDDLLLDLGDGYGGRVVDMSARVVYAPRNIQSILARGYWAGYVGEQNVEERIEGFEVHDLTPEQQAAYDAARAAWQEAG